HRLFYYITIICGSLVSLVITKNLDFYLDLAVNFLVLLVLVSTNIRMIYKSFEAIYKVWVNLIEIRVTV
ncbi:hypothetical protein LX36DRAFT_594326, partial [Colletotrichum falcatum]